MLTEPRGAGWPARAARWTAAASRCWRSRRRAADECMGGPLPRAGGPPPCSALPGAAHAPAQPPAHARRPNRPSARHPASRLLLRSSGRAALQAWSRPPSSCPWTCSRSGCSCRWPREARPAMWGRWRCCEACCAPRACRVRRGEGRAAGAGRRGGLPRSLSTPLASLRGPHVRSCTALPCRPVPRHRCHLHPRLPLARSLFWCL